MLRYIPSPIDYKKLLEENKVVIPCDDELFLYNDTSDEDWDEIKRRKVAEERKRNNEKKLNIKLKREEFKERHATQLVQAQMQQTKRSSSVGNLRSTHSSFGVSATQHLSSSRKPVAFLSPQRLRVNSSQTGEPVETAKKRTFALTSVAGKLLQEIDPNFVKESKLSRDTVQILKEQYLGAQKADFFTQNQGIKKIYSNQQITDKLGMTCASFNSKNFLIQPKFMENRGSMCITELWANKSKKSLIVKEKQTVQEMQHRIDISQEDREYSSIYRPGQLKVQKETIQRLKDQRQNMQVHPGNFNRMILKSMQKTTARILPSKLAEMYPQFSQGKQDPEKKKIMRRTAVAFKVRPSTSLDHTTSRKMTSVSEVKLVSRVDSEADDESEHEEVSPTIAKLE